MNTALASLLAIVCAALAAFPACAADPAVADPTAAKAIDPAYVKSVQDWRAQAEQNLKRDNGWLTLAGRYPLKMGENTFGTGPTLWLGFVDRPATLEMGPFPQSLPSVGPGVYGWRVRQRGGIAWLLGVATGRWGPGLDNSPRAE